MKERFKTPYHLFLNRLAEIAVGYHLTRVVSEQNGVGQMPTMELRSRLGHRVVGDESERVRR